MGVASAVGRSGRGLTKQRLATTSDNCRSQFWDLLRSAERLPILNSLRLNEQCAVEMNRLRLEIEPSADSADALGALDDQRDERL
ncbi:Uncharacterised protein [Actinomyces viscosus]|uniref:Uncharacterized protein n=1 Tax=Actinomyces viscosus TaxID=1656 RepID=A0A448PLG2_ACTVI|nr:Uncharacterised protein [Actinomyces viscosus]